MIVYIGGKINGLPNYEEVFKKAENELKKENYIVLNPAELPKGMPYKKYMPICCAMIDQCDFVYILNNFHTSEGTNCEIQYAKCTGKPIIYQKEV